MVVRLCLLALTFLLSVAGWLGDSPPRRPIMFADIPPELSGWIEQQGLSNDRFPAHIDSINKKTSEREERGEYEHLIYYMLQSQRFSSLPKVEPAMSAFEFVENLTQADKSRFLTDGSTFLPSIEKMPEISRKRMNDLVGAASGKRPSNERMTYFAGLIAKCGKSNGEVRQRLFAEYAETMRFLYRKEFSSRQVRREDLAAYVSSLYQSRGHSTDTQIEANYAVNVALASLKAQSPSIQLNRILIVGPGLDFAPRTDLIDDFDPQSYQPFAIADALLSLRLSDPSQLTIHCIDINDRVVNYLNALRTGKPVNLSIVSGVADTPLRPLTTDFKDYFGALGRSIGLEQPQRVPATLSRHMAKSLTVKHALVEKVSADRLNIVTERYDPSPGYDLVIVTNVFPYFSSTELLLALSNIAAMMREHAYLIHNDLYSIPAAFVAPLGLPLSEARTVLIATGQGQPLFDGIALHRKEQRKLNLGTQGRTPNFEQQRRIP
jgi:hypothetical protein